MCAADRASLCEAGVQAKRKRKLCNSLAGAVGNRAEVSWRNSARWLQHKPSELSTPAEIRGLDRFSLKCEGKTRRSVRMSLREGHLCGRSSESVVKLECKRSVSGSFATVSPVRWEIERKSIGARCQVIAAD